jgi:hypothetical protein
MRKRELNIDQFWAITGYYDKWNITPTSKTIEYKLEKKFKLSSNKWAIKTVTDFLSNLGK